MTAYLEGDDGDGHHAEPYHRQSIFAPEEARIEEANARNHYPDEGCRNYDPSDIPKIVNHGGAGLWVKPVDITSCEEGSSFWRVKDKLELTGIVSEVDHGTG